MKSCFIYCFRRLIKLKLKANKGKASKLSFPRRLELPDHEDAPRLYWLPTPGPEVVMFRLVPCAVMAECRKNETWYSVLGGKIKKATNS